MNCSTFSHVNSLGFPLTSILDNGGLCDHFTLTPQLWTVPNMHIMHMGEDVFLNYVITHNGAHHERRLCRPLPGSSSFLPFASLSLLHI